MSQKFHIADILSVTTGVLLCLPEFVEGRKYPVDGLYDILNYMSGESLQTVALGRTSDEAKPYLERQFPWTKDIRIPDFTKGTNGQAAITAAVRTFVQAMAAKYGEWHNVIPMNENDHEVLDPLEDVRRIDPTKGPDNVLKIDLTQEDDDPPSPYGDITWK